MICASLILGVFIASALICFVSPCLRNCLWLEVGGSFLLLLNFYHSPEEGIAAEDVDAAVERLGALMP